MMSNDVISVKAYAKKNHISMQSVYAKINRNSEKLKGHILRQNGKMILDSFAQNLLKPSDMNFALAEKISRLEKQLDEKTRQNEKLTKENKLLTDKISENDNLMEQLKSEVSEKSAETENLKIRITELTDKAVISEKFEERLNALFAVFENNANSSAVEKLGKLLMGKH